MSAVRQQLEALGVGFTIATEHTTVVDSFDVVCLFWCTHAALADIEGRYLRSAGHGKRGVVVCLDDSPVPESLRHLTLVRVIEAAHHESAPLRRSLPEWQEVVRTFIPDVVFDVEELRRQLRDVVREFRLWLTRPDVGESDFAHFWEELRPSVSGIAAAFCVACLSAALVMLHQFVLINQWLVLLAYIGLLVAWLFIGLPSLGAFLDSVFHLNTSFITDMKSPFAVTLGISFFVLVWGICAAFGHVRPPVLPLFILLITSFLVSSIALACWGAILSVAWLLISVRIWLVGKLPSKVYQCFISYRSSDVPAEVKRFIDELEGEATKQNVAFYDGWSIRQGSWTKPKLWLRLRLRAALRASGFVVTFISDDYLASHWCAYELSAAQAFRRPTLAFVAHQLSTENQSRIQPDAVRLFDYRSKAECILEKPDDSATRRAEARGLAEQFKQELRTFIARLCPDCNGHGTDGRYRIKLLPYAFRTACSRCKGTGMKDQKEEMARLIDAAFIDAILRGVFR